VPSKLSYSTSPSNPQLVVQYSASLRGSRASSSTGRSKSLPDDYGWRAQVLAAGMPLAASSSHFVPLSEVGRGASKMCCEIP
jgi:hypothetical protein